MPGVTDAAVIVAVPGPTAVSNTLDRSRIRRKTDACRHGNHTRITGSEVHRQAAGGCPRREVQCHILRSDPGDRNRRRGEAHDGSHLHLAARRGVTGRGRIDRGRSEAHTSDGRLHWRRSLSACDRDACRRNRYLGCIAAGKGDGHAARRRRRRQADRERYGRSQARPFDWQASRSRRHSPHSRSRSYPPVRWGARVNHGSAYSNARYRHGYTTLGRRDGHRRWHGCHA